MNGINCCAGERIVHNMYTHPRDTYAENNAWCRKQTLETFLPVVEDNCLLLTDKAVIESSSGIFLERDTVD